MNAADLVRTYGITSTAEELVNTPKLDEWFNVPGARHYKVTLRRAAAPAITTTYSQGPAITTEPKTADVLDCLISDAQTFEGCLDAADMAADLGMGYETDKERSEANRVYKATMSARNKLERFLPCDIDLMDIEGL